MRENKDLLEQLASHKVNPNDLLLQNYIDKVSKELQTSHLYPEKLARIKTELTETLKAVGSAEAIAVKEAAQGLRDNSLWYTRGKNAKADRIEAALCNTPLAERATVITYEGSANRVQEALASHRYLGKGGDVYKKGDQIDMDKSAHTFKMLKAEYKKIRAEEKVINGF